VRLSTICLFESRFLLRTSRRSLWTRPTNYNSGRLHKTWSLWDHLQIVGATDTATHLHILKFGSTRQFVLKTNPPTVSGCAQNKRTNAHSSRGRWQCGEQAHSAAQGQCKNPLPGTTLFNEKSQWPNGEASISCVKDRDVPGSRGSSSVSGDGDVLFTKLSNISY